MCVVCVRSHTHTTHVWHVSLISGIGLATISRLQKIIGLFCKIALKKRLSSAKETYHFKEPTHRSHPNTN